MKHARVGPPAGSAWAILAGATLLLLAPTAEALTLRLDGFLLPDEPWEIRFDFDGQTSLRFLWFTEPGLANFSINRVGGPPTPEDFEGPNGQGTGTIRPTQPGGYAVRWDSVERVAQRIRVHFEGDARFVDARGVHQIDPAEYAPAVPLATSLLALLGVVLRRR